MPDETLPLTEPELAALAAMSNNLASTKVAHLAALKEIAAAEGMVQGALRSIILMRGLEGDWDVANGKLIRKGNPQ